MTIRETIAKKMIKEMYSGCYWNTAIECEHSPKEIYEEMK